MKKTFWGYTVKEVDETIDALTKQNTALLQRNDHLEDELKNQNVYLEEIKSNMANSITQAEMDEYKELKAAYAALQNRVNDDMENSEEMKTLRAELAAARADVEKAGQQTETLRAELAAARADAEKAGQQTETLRAELAAAQADAEKAGQQAEMLRAEPPISNEEIEQDKQEIKNLRAKLTHAQAKIKQSKQQIETLNAELTAAQEHNAAPNTGVFRSESYALNDMMQRVGKAICETSDNTYQSMMDTVSEFAAQWEQSNKELEKLLAEFDAAKENTRVSLADMTLVLQNRFDQMSQKSESMHTSLRDLASRRESLQQSLSSIVEQLRADEPAAGEIQAETQSGITEKLQEEAESSVEMSANRNRKDLTKTPDKPKRRFNLI